jgi:hypothetical protein
VGSRAVRLILAALAASSVLTACGDRVETFPSRPACAEEYVNGRPTGWCQNWPDAPVPAPTSSYDGRIAPAGDRRPIEQNPTCWITNPGWPYECKRSDT